MIVLVRHAATEWTGIRYCGRTDVGLSREGREQLRPLAEYLATLAPPGVTVVASPSLRCRETAIAIARSVAGVARFDERLREVDFGDAEGLTFAELERRWPGVASRVLRDAPVDWPGGERWSDLIARVAAAWRELSAAPRDVVVVGHGGPLRLMLGLALPPGASAEARLGPAHVVALESERACRPLASWSPP